ncbi:TPA: hypothetical protein ACIQMB_005460 [Bacillus pacificus]
MEFLSLNEIKEIASLEGVDIIEAKVRKGVDELPILCFKSDSIKDIANFFMFARKANINTIFCYTETYESDFFRLDSTDINRFIDIDIIERETVLDYILADIEAYNEQFDQYEEGEECNRVLFFYKDRMEHCIVLRKEWLEGVLSKEEAMFRILAEYADELQELEEAWEENE